MILKCNFQGVSMLWWMFLHINVLSLFILSSQSLLCQVLT